MSISGINKILATRPAIKTAIIYLGVAVFCVLFDRVYWLFGNGVEANAMLFLFLYPLLGGFVPFLMLGLFLPGIEKKPFYRLASNAYHSGIALLSVGSVLTGIVEIAGASSDYIVYFTIIGFAFLIVGIAVFFFGLIKQYKKSKS